MNIMHDKSATIMITHNHEIMLSPRSKSKLHTVIKLVINQVYENASHANDVMWDLLEL